MENSTKTKLVEAIKGWKHAHSDIMKNRAAAASADNEVVLHSLKKDGSESGMHDARKTFKSEEEAREYHKRVRGLNPNRNIRHNLYINGKHAETLGESVELDEAIKLGSKVTIHDPGQSHHGKTGYVGEIRHGAYKGAPKTYTVDYDHNEETGRAKSIQLDKKNVKLHKEEVELDEAGAFSYGAKPPRKGSVAYNAMMKRKEQEKNKAPIEPKDQMIGVAKRVSEEVELDEGIDKHSFIGKIVRKHQLKKKVDQSWKDAVDAEKAGDKKSADRSFEKHVRYANLERPGTWSKVKEETELDEVAKPKGFVDKNFGKPPKESKSGFKIGQRVAHEREPGRTSHGNVTNPDVVSGGVKGAMVKFANSHEFIPHK